MSHIRQYLDLILELGVGTHTTSEEDHFGIFLLRCSEEFFG